MNDHSDPETTRTNHSPGGEPTAPADCGESATLSDRASHSPATETALDPVRTEQGIPLRSAPNIPGYEVLVELGRGGMGVVYQARQIGVNRIIALKVLSGGREVNPMALARFQIEAEAVAALQHPSIVQLFEFGSADGTEFLALEYVGGGTLAERLRRETYTPRQSAELVRQLATAIHAAHQKAILHRDLKPGNVLLTEYGLPKITDFGLARVGHSDLTLPGAVMGTPNYMSPEQAGGEVGKIGTPTDVWGLGAILYEMLTGQAPFRGPNVHIVLAAVIHDEVVPPSQLNKRVPCDLEMICLKCLQKEPGDRYPTADALATDLRAYLDGLPVSARPVGFFRRTWKWVRRNPFRAATLTAVFAAGLSAGVWVPRYRSNEILVQGAVRSGVWVERDVDAEAALQVIDQEGYVYKYSGAPVDFWIELRAEGENLVTIHPTKNGLHFWEPKDSIVPSGQQIEGSFVWVRGKPDNKGVEIWQIGHKRVKFTRVQTGSDLSNMFVSTSNKETKSDVKTAQAIQESRLKVWPGNFNMEQWRNQSRSIQNPIPTDKSICILELKGGFRNGETYEEAEKKGYNIRLLCQAVDESAK